MPGHCGRPPTSRRPPVAMTRLSPRSARPSNSTPGRAASPWSPTTNERSLPSIRRLEQRGERSWEQDTEHVPGRTSTPSDGSAPCSRPARGRDALPAACPAALAPPGRITLVAIRSWALPGTRLRMRASRSSPNSAQSSHSLMSTGWSVVIDTSRPQVPGSHSDRASASGLIGSIMRRAEHGFGGHNARRAENCGDGLAARGGDVRT